MHPDEGISSQETYNVEEKIEHEKDLEGEDIWKDETLVTSLERAYEEGEAIHPEGEVQHNEETLNANDETLGHVDHIVGEEEHNGEDSNPHENEDVLGDVSTTKFSLPQLESEATTVENV